MKLEEIIKNKIDAALNKEGNKKPEEIKELDDNDKDKEIANLKAEVEENKKEVESLKKNIDEILEVDIDKIVNEELAKRVAQPPNQEKPKILTDADDEL